MALAAGRIDGKSYRYRARGRWSGRHGGCFGYAPKVREAGFTLLEMIVVLVVLGLMATLIVARGPPRSAALDLRAAAGEIAQALHDTRGQAIETGRRVVFHLDVRAHAFSVGDSAPRLLPASLGLNITGTSREAAAGGSAGISFASDGSSSGGTIDLAVDARRFRIVVDWLTGRVTTVAMSANSK